MDHMAEFNTIVMIVERAERMGIGQGTRITRVMDIHNAHKQFNLRLEEMLSAEDFDFTHDFTGIQASINRNTGRVENHFVPRFAGRR